MRCELCDREDGTIRVTIGEIVKWIGLDCEQALRVCWLGRMAQMVREVDCE